MSLPKPCVGSGEGEMAAEKTNALYKERREEAKCPSPASGEKQLTTEWFPQAGLKVQWTYHHKSGSGRS